MDFLNFATPGGCPVDRRWSRRVPAWMTLFWLLVHPAAARSAEVLQVTWPTKLASEPPRLPPAAAGNLPAFRLALVALPEASIVALALSEPAILNLTADQAGSLRPLLAERYRILRESALYAQAPSALPYCYADPKPATGLASVYAPAGAGPSTPAILFLHGYGGSFLWYQHYLSEMFSGHIIVCPAYGVTTASIPAAYLAESMEAAAKQLGFPIAKPCLLGLSAGGSGACKAYVASPASFSQLICLAASPPAETTRLFPPQGRANFLSGGLEPFVVFGEFQREIDKIHRRCRETKAAVIPGADHFFLLTHPMQTTGYLQSWVGDK